MFRLPFPTTGRLLSRHDWQEAVTAEPEQLDHPTRDRPLDPFRIPVSDAARAVVGDVTKQLQGLETHDGLRKRARKAADQVRFEAAVSALVCDLIHRHLTVPEGWLSLSLSNDHLGRGGRYSTPTTTKTLPAIIENLARAEMEFLVTEKGHKGYGEIALARRTVLQAGPRLLTRIREQRLTLADLGRAQGEEVIILRREKVDRWDDGGEVDYTDTPDTLRYRQDLQAINAWLGEADLELVGSAGPGAQRIDTTARRLRRYFTHSSFESCGRLYRGFWIDMRKSERRRLRIAGEPVVTLDYAQMAPRIAYGLVGVTPQWTDAYTLPGLEGHRAGVKKIFNALLFAEKKPERFPAGTRDLFPARATIRDVVDAIVRLHAPIAPLFFTGIGHRLQFIESEVLVAVLLGLKDKEIVALPVHDAVIVAESAIEGAREVMLRVFKEKTGVEGQVREEQE